MLKLMNDIIESMPLSMENAADGRYTWPARWSELFNQIENWPEGVSQQAHAADAGKPCENGEHRFFQGFCTKCNKYIGTAD